MQSQFGLKELYDVTLKSTYPMELNGRTIEAYEVIALFDKIQIANFNEVKSNISAKGGFDNRSLIYWTTTKELDLSFTQGVFSKEQLALMANAQLINYPNQVLDISCREELESNEQNIVTTKYNITLPLFVYDKSSGTKITPTNLENNHFTIGSSYKDVIVDYQYHYTSVKNTLVIGQELTSGFLQLEGKTRIKDDVTGQTVTGIIKIPKLKLMSDLSMRLGQDGQPVVGRLDAVAIPIGVRGEEKVMEIHFLNDDIDSDF